MTWIVVISRGISTLSAIDVHYIVASGSCDGTDIDNSTCIVSRENSASNKSYDLADNGIISWEHCVTDVSYADLLAPNEGLYLKQRRVVVMLVG